MNDTLRERVARWLYKYSRPQYDYALWSEMSDEDREAFRKEADAILALFAEERKALMHDIDAYRGALGYPVPGTHNAKLTSGEQPICGLCDAKEKLLAAAEAREAKLVEALKVAKDALLRYGHAIRCQYGKPGASPAYPLGGCTCGYFKNLIDIDAALASVKEEK